MRMDSSIGPICSLWPNLTKYIQWNLCIREFWIPVSSCKMVSHSDCQIVWLRPRLDSCPDGRKVLRAHKNKWKLSIPCKYCYINWHLEESTSSEVIRGGWSGASVSSVHGQQLSLLSVIHPDMAPGAAHKRVTRIIYKLLTLIISKRSANVPSPFTNSMA